jgi:ABC-type lipoprotein release transport system permease subunit
MKPAPVSPGRKPLRASVYLARNAAKTLPLAAVIVLAVMLVAGIVSLINSIPLSIRTIYSYSKQYLGITPRGDASMTPQLRKIVEEESPVEVGRIMTLRGSEIEVRSIVGNWPFVVLALEQQDMRFFVERMGGGSINGRFPEAGEPGVIISRNLAKNLKLELGSVLLKPEDMTYFSPNEVKVVGIVDNPNWFVLAPVEYYRLHHFPPIDVLLVFAKDASQQPSLDAWAMERFKGMNARLFTYAELEKQADTMFTILYQILNVVIGTLVIVITIMMGMLMNIYLTQRTEEFGLLQALGYSRRSILTRVVIETFLTVMGGWVLGLVVAFGLLNLVRVQLFDPSAFAVDTLDRQAYLYTIPIPIAIMITAFVTVWLKFRTFDPVGVVERRLV